MQAIPDTHRCKVGTKNINSLTKLIPYSNRITMIIIEPDNGKINIIQDNTATAEKVNQKTFHF